MTVDADLYLKNLKQLSEFADFELRPALDYLVEKMQWGDSSVRKAAEEIRAEIWRRNL